MEKVMFLAAVGRPMKRAPFGVVEEAADEDSWYFDGKVGIWPFVRYEAARRSSRNRPRGTPIVIPISVTAAVFEMFVLTKLLPAIKANCPETMRQRMIYIQLDNASPHNINIENFYQTCFQLEINCRLIRQPPQSPDTNICDLCFFPSIQSLYYKQTGVNNKESIINAVDRAFQLYDPNLLNRAYLSLFTNYNNILCNYGSNCFQIGHMNKNKLEVGGLLPVSVRIRYPPDYVPDDVDDEEDLINDIANNLEDYLNVSLEEEEEA
jgi:hypothetical protein